MSSYFLSYKIFCQAVRADCLQTWWLLTIGKCTGRQQHIQGDDKTVDA